MKPSWFIKGMRIAVVLAAGALGCDEQRSCPSDFSCAELVKLSCGENGECASAQSCTAAKRLQTDGDQAACESAWCALGEAYRECE